MDQQQWTPLHSAAENGHLRVCELIINKVSEKNPKDLQGWTPLHSAAQNGHLEVCELILRNIRKCNSVRKGNLQTYIPFDDFGNNPLKLATQFFHQQIVTLILKFIFDAEERKGTFDDFKIQLVQDLEKQYIEIQKNNKKKGINDFHLYQLMKRMKKKQGPDADDRDDYEVQLRGN